MIFRGVVGDKSFEEEDAEMTRFRCVVGTTSFEVEDAGVARFRVECEMRAANVSNGRVEFTDGSCRIASRQGDGQIRWRYGVMK